MSDKVVYIEGALACPNPTCGFEGVECLRCMMNMAAKGVTLEEEGGGMVGETLDHDDALFINADMINQRFPEVVDSEWEFRLRTRRFNVVPIDEGDSDERTAEQQ